ncbi:hypothetical protein Prudu_602S000200, partial [Prunus dulcis]
LCAKRATDFQKVLAPPPSSNGHGTGGVGTTVESPTFSNRHQPRGRPELAGKSCFPTEASEVQPISMRKLQRAIEVRGIHHRASQSFRTTKWKKFGFGQITGETLPKFRQKSKGEFKRI